MSTRRRSTLVAGLCLVLIGCTQRPSVDIRAEADALRSLDADWTVAAKARDIDRMVSSCAPDIVFMYPNDPMGVGVQALRTSWESWLADTAVSRTYVLTSDAVEVSSSGDLAFTRGTSRWSQTTPDGPAERLERWVAIYKKIDGKWKLIVDISTPMSQ